MDVYDELGNAFHVFLHCIQLSLGPEFRRRGEAETDPHKKHLFLCMAVRLEDAAAHFDRLRKVMSKSVFTEEDLSVYLKALRELNPGLQPHDADGYTFDFITAATLIHLDGEIRELQEAKRRYEQIAAAWKPPKSEEN